VAPLLKSAVLGSAHLLRRVLALPEIRLISSNRPLFHSNFVPVFECCGFMK